MPKIEGKIPVVDISTKKIEGDIKGQNLDINIPNIEGDIKVPKIEGEIPKIKGDINLKLKEKLKSLILI